MSERNYKDGIWTTEEKYDRGGHIIKRHAGTIKKMNKELKYKLPIYHDSETEFEDIIYSFFRKVGEDE